MNHNQKRYRQINLQESFAFSKRPKPASIKMAEKSGNANQFSTNREIPSECINYKAVNTCQVVEDIKTAEKFGNGNQISTNSETSSECVGHKEVNTCQAVKDAVRTNNESCETDTEIAIPDSEICELHDTDDSFKNSDDIFPSDPSLEEDTEYSEASASNSAELFPDSGSQSDPESDEICDMSILNKSPDCDLPLPKLEPTASHSIMFSPHIRPGDAPRPYPSSYRDKWDTDHVRMPCSPLSRYPVRNSPGGSVIISRWNIICRALRSDIESSKELEDAIMKYNTHYIGKWNFEGLHDFINRHLTDGERVHFFESILPHMIEMALDLPNICTQPVPLLKSGKNHYITMSQKQIGCLLLNAFFCTFPRRPQFNRSKKQRGTHEYALYPDINFNRLFYGVKYKAPRCNAEKLKCLLNYFIRITSKEPSGTVTFHRQCIENSKLPMWQTSAREMRTAVIKSSGVIETEGQGMLQVDFANKFIGGGVLGQGCVQEEIRFVICPELIVSRLFVECLANNEVLKITGVEQYNKYSGYADTFKWEGDFKDETPRDLWGRRCTQLVAMDAVSFRNSSDQFKSEYIKRELNKAYCGFYDIGPPAHLSAIATGNWGCGAFKGNANLKFLIQFMAASEAGRDLLYFTFGDKKLKKQMQDMYEFLSNKDLAVGDCWRLIKSYDDNVSLSIKEQKYNLYDFIYSRFVIKGENSRQQEEGEDNKDQSFDDSDNKALSKLFEDVAFGGSSTEIEDIT